MAADQSPHSTPELSSFSPSTNASRKRKRASHQGPTTREFGFMRDTGEHDSARFVGSSSGIHFIRNVHVRLARRSANRTYQGTDSQIQELVPGEDDQLRRKTAQKDDETIPLWKDSEICGDEETSPSFEQLVKWSKSYFESWHPILPFLHGPDVLRIFEDVSTSGVSSLHHLDRSILRSILSISLADSRQGTSLDEPIPSSLLFRTVDEAVSNSQFALCQPASIRSTQAALSIQLFLISMLCLNAASRLGGLIVRMAFHLGLHRCPTRYPFFTGEEAARRRRVFWCLYCCERFLSQSLGLPLDIRDDDIDVCYPGEEIHGIAAAEDRNDRRLVLLTYMAKHAKIRGLILELRNKSLHVRQDTAEKAMPVHTELAKWANEIQDTIEEADLADELNDGSASSISPSHRLVLLMSKYESTISLNRPMMTSDPSSPLWSSAMQACISAAKSICITMKRYSARNKKASDQEGKTLAAPMLWPAFIWATWISAFVLAYAAFEQQMPLESAIKHIESSKEALRHIATRDTSWPEYCLSAIDELTSAVKDFSQRDENAAVQGPSGEASEADASQSTTTRVTRSRTSGPAYGSNSIPYSSSEHAEANPQQRNAVPPVVVSSAGLGQGITDQFANDDSMQRRPTEYPGFPIMRNDNFRAPASVGPSQSAWASQMNTPAPGNGQFQGAVPFNGADAGDVPLPGEGQESMMWYDQLFDSSFSAIDNPFLAAAQFDSTIDPTWSYLR